jgi:hypothetical protein
VSHLALQEMEKQREEEEEEREGKMAGGPARE